MINYKTISRVFFNKSTKGKEMYNEPKGIWIKKVDNGFSIDAWQCPLGITVHHNFRSVINYLAKNCFLNNRPKKITTKTIQTERKDPTYIYIRPVSNGFVIETDHVATSVHHDFQSVLDYLTINYSREDKSEL